MITNYIEVLDRVPFKFKQNVIDKRLSKDTIYYKSTYTLHTFVIDWLSGSIINTCKLNPEVELVNLGSEIHYYREIEDRHHLYFIEIQKSLRTLVSHLTIG